MSHSEAPRARHSAVDAIKGIAIVFVLILHAYTDAIPYSFFWVRQAVPLLMVMMGFTGALTRVKPIGAYFRRRAVRLLVPWGVAWVVALAIVLLKGGSVWRSAMLLGALPSPGPGNYFITIAFAFALLLPVLRWLLDRGPWVLLITCFAVDLSFQLAAAALPLDAYLFKASLFRYLFAVALGMLLANGRTFWPLLPVSLAYLVALTAGVTMPFLRSGWQSHFLLASGYTAALATVGLRISWPRWLESFGRASWHIFLVQIIWYAQISGPAARVLGLGAWGSNLFDIALCLVVGLVFWRAEGWLTDTVRARFGRPQALPA